MGESAPCRVSASLTSLLSFAPLPVGRPGVKTYRYSDDGRLFASVSNSTYVSSGVNGNRVPQERLTLTRAPFHSIEVVDSQNGAVVSQIPAKGVLDIFLSPLGTQVQAWERQGEWSALKRRTRHDLS